MHLIFQFLPFQRCHGDLGYANPLGQLENIAADGEQLLIDRILAGQVLMLGQVADLPVFGENGISAVRIFQAHYDLEESGFAGAVYSDESGFFVFFYMEGYTLQDIVSVIGFANIRYIQYHVAFSIRLFGRHRSQPRQPFIITAAGKI